VSEGGSTSSMDVNLSPSSLHADDKELEGGGEFMEGHPSPYSDNAPSSLGSPGHDERLPPRAPKPDVECAPEPPSPGGGPSDAMPVAVAPPPSPPPAVAAPELDARVEGQAPPALDADPVRAVRKPLTIAVSSPNSERPSPAAAPPTEVRGRRSPSGSFRPPTSPRSWGGEHASALTTTVVSRVVSHCLFSGPQPRRYFVAMEDRPRGEALPTSDGSPPASATACAGTQTGTGAPPEDPMPLEPPEQEEPADHEAAPPVDGVEMAGAVDDVVEGPTSERPAAEEEATGSLTLERWKDELAMDDGDDDLLESDAYEDDPIVRALRARARQLQDNLKQV
jgi:hypothetical protein